LRIALYILLGVAILSAQHLSAQHLPDIYKDELHGDPPYLSQPGWKSLLNGKDITGWHADGGGKHEWFAARSINWRRVFNPKMLVIGPAGGDRLVNGKAGKTTDLMTDEKFGDFELYLEFIIPRGSNSGVFLHGLYEIQIFDSYDYRGPFMVGDCGGIYAGADGHGGSPPLLNASRPPGEWQSFHIWFQAPRFDAQGKKIANAKVLRVLLNDTLVQREFELDGPTGSHKGDALEAPTNPLMLQGDHGPVAFRNIYIRPLQP
jgi:hypothetical protein